MTHQGQIRIVSTVDSTSFNAQPSAPKNLFNWALTFNGQNSSQSFLRSHSWVIILNTTWIKSFISFVDVCMCSVTLLCLPFAAPRTVACQASLPWENSRQEYQSGVPFPPPGNIPDPVIKPTSLASPVSAGRALPLELISISLTSKLHENRNSCSPFLPQDLFIVPDTYQGLSKCWGDKKNE